MAKDKIDYNPTVIKKKPGEKFGSERIRQGNPELPEEHRKTLLHLLFRLVYTNEGREKHLPWPPKLAVQAEREHLEKVFRDEYGIDDAELRAALIDGHQAASRYVGPTLTKGSDKLNAQDRAQMEEAEKEYIRNLDIIMGRLKQDALSRDFSLLW